MSKTEKRSVSLPAERARFIVRLISSGAYSSVSEVVRAGLNALQEQDSALDHWAAEAVRPTYDAIAAAPNRALGLDNVVAALRKHHENSLSETR